MIYYCSPNVDVYGFRIDNWSVFTYSSTNNDGRNYAHSQLHTYVHLLNCYVFLSRAISYLPPQNRVNITLDSTVKDGWMCLRDMYEALEPQTSIFFVCR